MARTGRPPKAKVAEVKQGLDLIDEALEVITLCEYRGHTKQDVVNAALYRLYKTDQKTQDALIKTVQSKQTKEVEDAKEEASDEVQSSDMEEAIEGGEDTLEEVIRSIQ